MFIRSFERLNKIALLYGKRNAQNLADNTNAFIPVTKRLDCLLPNRVGEVAAYARRFVHLSSLYVFTSVRVELSKINN
jgi:hypothetical protein